MMLTNWYRVMALKYCGRDYGSNRRNHYFFLRACYGMNALEAWKATREHRT